MAVGGGVAGRGGGASRPTSRGALLAAISAWTRRTSQPVRSNAKSTNKISSQRRGPRRRRGAGGGTATGPAAGSAGAAGRSGGGKSWGEVAMNEDQRGVPTLDTHARGQS